MTRKARLRRNRSGQKGLLRGKTTLKMYYQEGKARCFRERYESVIQNTAGRLAVLTRQTIKPDLVVELLPLNQPLEKLRRYQEH